MMTITNAAEIAGSILFAGAGIGMTGFGILMFCLTIAICQDIWVNWRR